MELRFQHDDNTEGTLRLTVKGINEVEAGQIYSALAKINRTNTWMSVNGRFERKVSSYWYTENPETEGLIDE